MNRHADGQPMASAAKPQPNDDSRKKAQKGAKIQPPLFASFVLFRGKNSGGLRKLFKQAIREIRAIRQTPVRR
jgi:hypothetical protein